MVFLMVRPGMYNIEDFWTCYEVVEAEAVLDLHTEHLLHFEKGRAPDRLYRTSRCYAVYGSRWHYGNQPGDLKEGPVGR